MRLPGSFHASERKAEGAGQGAYAVDDRQDQQDLEELGGASAGMMRWRGVELAQI